MLRTYYPYRHINTKRNMYILTHFTCTVYYGLMSNA